MKRICLSGRSWRYAWVRQWLRDFLGAVDMPHLCADKPDSLTRDLKEIERAS